MSAEVQDLIRKVRDEIAGQDETDEDIESIAERENGGETVHYSEYEAVTDDLANWARSHYVVLTEVLAYLEKQSNVLHAVYFAEGEYDSALIYRDADEAERVAKQWCEERGEGYAWTDWVTVR